MFALRQALVCSFFLQACATAPRPTVPARGQPAVAAEAPSPAFAPPANAPPLFQPTAPDDLAPVERPTTCAVPTPTGLFPERRGSGHDRWIPGLYAYDARVPGRVALTFDDGPNRFTPGLLDVLAAHGAKATFFVLGKSIWAGTMPFLQRAVREGHALGNHTYRHDFTFGANVHPVLARRFYEAELVLTQIRVDLALLARDGRDFDALDARVFGRYGRFLDPGLSIHALPHIRARHAEVLAERNAGRSPYPMHLARPPFGRPFYMGPERDRGLVAEVMNQLGLLHILWHGSSGDSDPAVPPPTRYSTPFLAGRMLEHAERGGVLLAHDRMPTHALDAALRAYAERGVTITPLAELVAEKFGCPTPAALWAALPARAPEQAATP